jgi:hypothetical protein
MDVVRDLVAGRAVAFELGSLEHLRIEIQAFRSNIRKIYI